MKRLVTFVAAAVLLTAMASFSPAEDLAAITRPGANIQRTMKLLEGSTPEKRNTVRVLFYGQSITAQAWTKTVGEELRKRYPNANLVIENRAIGGFTAPSLIKTAEYDLYPTYPDLLVFHVYGAARDGMARFEEIIRRTRTRTTADIVLATHHDIGRESDYKESEQIRQIALKYHCGLVDILTHWREVLAKEQLSPKAFLSDNIHLNPKGCELYARLINAFLRYDPALGPASANPVTEIPIDGANVKRSADGAIELEFTGNRIDAIASPASGSELIADVLIDGRKPSSFPEAYSLTRPSTAPFTWFPAFKTLGHDKPPVVEDWTLRMLSSTPDGKTLRFQVVGSVTGEDGEGTNTEKFVSKSGRVVIDGGENWMVAWSLQYKKKEMPAEFKVTWQVVPHFVDVLQFPSAKADGTEQGVTLIQGISNGAHTLRLMPRAGAAVKLQGFRVYRPTLATEGSP
jgi:hypothetical protein